MRIKVNVHLLGHRPGDIMKEGDRFYEDFKAWAVMKSTRNGAVICEICRALEENNGPIKVGVSGYIGSATEKDEPSNAIADPGSIGWRTKKSMKRANPNVNVQEKD